ncbi:hypothetical protein CLV74_101439 [Donghicola tyrosinivorans]|uniref:Uncharacterized protein n=1 Tax=Donghicola tyrosinivorans TaxID=1652492 RepID=A0A2T0X5R9_9RHOB|nr:hypothetical protein CLV74_101439 [Donghicola tyrosinivorans]
MAKARLTDSEINQIIDLLSAWKGPLNWEVLLARTHILLKRPFTRQGLAKQENILIAFQQAKDRIRTQKPVAKKSPPEIELMQNTIDSLRAKISVLEAERHRYDEQFVTWLYNARSRGISEIDLNRPLPTVNRNASTTD